MLDLIDAIRDMLEPPADPPETVTIKLEDRTRAASGTWRDMTGAEPFLYHESPDTLFMFEWGPDVRSLAGASPHDREDFSIQAIYVADSQDEESQQRRRRDVTQALDAKRELYAKLIRNHRSASSWSHLQCSIDGDYIRAFEIRGFALRISGWRIVTD